MNIIIVTGLSGAGKSQAANALEDIGYFCIDNMPPSLIPKFAEMSMQLNRDGNVAIVTDVRTGDMFGGFFDALEELRSINAQYKILFLDANDDVLVKRYSESRRKHPLSTDNVGIAEAIRDERVMLKPVFELADYHVDTTYISNQQLRDRIVSLFLSDRNASMKVRCISFGFKYGLPNESDLVYDVRFLPNPFYIDELKNKTGLDSEVFDYVMEQDAAKQYITKLCDLTDFLLPQYRSEGKSQLVISIGCTGGKHRSVAIAEELARHITENGFKCKAIHRDINKLV
jgi:Predicted P-loop-containing kinase